MNILFILINIGRSFLCPIWPLVSFFVPKVKERLDLERNSFKSEFDRSAISIHVSSEGELEQVMPIIERVISQNKKIQLMFTSKSVLSKIENLALLYPQNIDFKAMPLLDFNVLSSLPWGQNIAKWVNSEVVVMVRYDFFPELMLLGLKKRFILLSATLKGKKEGGLGYLFHLKCLSFYELIFTATAKDLSELTSLFPLKKIKHYEFRIAQIIRRIKSGKERLEKLSSWESFKSHIESFDYDKRVILGSAWAIDLNILKDSDLADQLNQGKALLLIAPHVLLSSSIDEITKTLSSLGIRNISHFDEAHFTASSVVICSTPGILCELYPLFGQRYIGGGFGRSVHSLLEPFCGKGGNLYFGPRTHRSTEFDFISQGSLNKISVLDSPEQFYSEVKKSFSTSTDDSSKELMLKEYCEKESGMIQLVLGNS